jgi:hypothetical protein
MHMHKGLVAAAVGCALIVPTSRALFWKREDKAARTVPADPPVAMEPAQVPAGSLQSAASDPAVAAPTRRPHQRLEGPEAEQALVQLAESRRLREEELRVLARLHAEKRGELARMNEQLLERFGIASDETYQYDAEAKTLYKLTAKPDMEALAAGGVTDPEELFEKSRHRIFAQREQELGFVRLVSAKKITGSELQVIQLLVKEKNMELEKVLGSLKDRFSISPDKHYEYDAEAQTLFEVVRAGAPEAP